MSNFPVLGTYSNPNLEEGPFQTALEDQLAATKQLPGGSAETELTIASGSITPTAACHKVDTEADAATDDLTHLNPVNLPDGGLVMLRAVNSGRVVTVKHAAGGTGEIHLVNGTDVNLDPDTRLVLIREGSLWREAGLASVRATASRPGVVELATPAEAAAGTDGERAVTPAGLQGVVNGISRSTVRQTVLSTALDASGYADFLSGIGTGSVVIDATPTPIDLSFADGFAAGMPVDYAARVSADGSVNAAAGGVNYLYADYNNGSPVFDKTMVPPLYQWAVPTDGIEHGAILADFEGANGATSFSGAYGEAWTFSAANASINTAAYKFGSSSVRLAGTNGYVQVAAPNMASGNWTIEFWFRLDATGTNQCLLDDTVTNNKILLAVGSTSKIWYYLGQGSSWNISAGTGSGVGSTTISANNWYHFALVFDGTNYKGYVNGSLDAAISSTSSIAQPSGLKSGIRFNNTDYPLTGYIDDFRFSPFARYLSGFSAPMAAFTAEDLHYFRIPEMRMYKGRPGAWTAARRLFLGEADTGADGTIDTVKSYALRGKHLSGWKTITASTTANYNHNLGTVPESVALEAKCVSAEATYVAGDICDFSWDNSYAGTSDGRAAVSYTRNVWTLKTGAYPFAPGFYATPTKWNLRAKVNRGW
jgi:hypothetical protein